LKRTGPFPQVPSYDILDALFFFPPFLGFFSPFPAFEHGYCPRREMGLLAASPPPPEGLPFFLVFFSRPGLRFFL